MPISSLTQPTPITIIRLAVGLKVTLGGTKSSVLVSTINVGDVGRRSRRPRRKVMMPLNLTTVTLKTDQ